MGKLILIARINWAFLRTSHCAGPFTCISFFISKDNKAGMIVPSSLIRKIRHWVKAMFKVILSHSLSNRVDLKSVFSVPISYCSNPASPQMRAWEGSENSKSLMQVIKLIEYEDYILKWSLKLGRTTFRVFKDCIVVASSVASSLVNCQLSTLICRIDDNAFPTSINCFFFNLLYLQNFQMILILLQKRKVDPEAQNLPDMEIGNEKDAVLTFKPHVV